MFGIERRVHDDMKNGFTLKNSVEKIIVENKLYEVLIGRCRDGLILAEKKSGRILMMNDNVRDFLDMREDEKPTRISEILNEEQIGQLLEEKTVKDEIMGRPAKFVSAVKGEYLWIFVVNQKDVIKAESLSQKALELNQELISTFNEYGDDTLMITDGNGIIEFAGEKIAQTCDVSPEFFLGKSVYDMERQGLFRPSVTAKVISSGQPQVVIQTTCTGEEVVAVGAPMTDRSGKLEKVVSVTRNYSTQLKVSRMVAELGEKLMTDRKTRSEEDDEIITCNDQMFEIKTLINMIADTKATVLITGETGTGKEMVARYIYRLSDRSKMPFIKVNCGTISHSIVESELFGYEEGSFTGASKGGKIGLIEAANGGTLFLDEISELPIEQQVKLLHVLQEKMLIRVGGTESIDLDIRIIAATNKDLEEQVALGNFREDLYYRLNVIPINIPPLRKRREDIPLLSKYFFKKFCDMYNKEMQLSNSVMAALEKYSWPGNIRQLENTIERLVLTIPKPIITVEDLPRMLSPEENDQAVKVERILKLDDAVKILEKELIKMALDEYGTTVRAAEALGINQSTVSRKMAQYDLKQ